MLIGAVLRPRCGGKSSELAKIARQNPHATVVVLNMNLRDHFATTFHVPLKQIITFRQFREGDVFRGRPAMVGPLLFDNFEYMLAELLGRDVSPDTQVIISATGLNL